MTYRTKFFLPLILLSTLICPVLMASHEANEPSDGTVNSFRWLKTPAPVGNVSMRDIDGQQVFISEFRGKVILVNLWASWCPPCIKELPALDRMQKRLGGDNFTILAISLDKDPQLARDMFIDRLSIRHLDLYTEAAEKLGYFFPVDVLPANFIIDDQGRVLAMLRSYVNWDDPQVDRLFNRLTAADGETDLEKTQYRPLQ